MSSYKIAVIYNTNKICAYFRETSQPNDFPFIQNVLQRKMIDRYNCLVSAWENF